MQNKNPSGIFRHQCLPSQLLWRSIPAPEKPTPYFDAWISSTQSAKTIDLVAPDLFQATPPNAACYIHKKNEIYGFESSNKSNKKVFFFGLIIFKFFYFQFAEQY